MPADDFMHATAESHPETKMCCFCDQGSVVSYFLTSLESVKRKTATGAFQFAVMLDASRIISVACSSFAV